MKCTQCGEEIESGKLYCEKCGAEVQIVPTYNPLEDDTIAEFIKEKSESTIEPDKTDNTDLVSSETSEIATKDAKSRWLYIAIPVLFIAVVVCLTLYINNKKHGTYEYKYSQAMTAYADGDYRLALSRFKELRSMPEVRLEDFLYEAGVSYFCIEDYTNAISIFREYLSLKNDYTLAYEYMIKSYLMLEDYDSLDSLKEDYSLDRDILDVYILEAPKITSEEGSFNQDYVLSMKNDHNYMMYYSLDGSDPITGIQYLTPVMLTEGDYEIRAVCVSEKALYTHEDSISVSVKYKEPAVPKIEPAGGDITTATDIVISSDENVDIYYSFDGSDPLTGGELYDGPFKIIEPCSFVIKIMAVDKRGLTSRVITYRFKVTE